MYISLVSAVLVKLNITEEENDDVREHKEQEEVERVQETYL
jgi:hypothetical protein